MSGEAFDRVKATFESAGCTVHDRGDRFSASTPGHSSGDTGSYVKKYDKGVTLSVFNDDRDKVMATLGLTMSDLFDRPKTTYTYSDHRKFNRVYKPDGTRAFYPDPQNPAGNALYRVEHLPADHSITVYVCEGEKDCDIAATEGLIAVSQSGGAMRSPAEADWEPLRGRPVTIVADIDAKKGGEPGRSRAEKVYTTLAGMASSVRIVHAANGNDLGDHIAADLGVDDLVAVDTSHLGDTSSGSDAQDGKPSAATALVRLATERYRLGITADGDPFAVAKETSHVVKMLRAGRTGLRAELSSAYFAKHDRTAPQQALADALLVLEGQARNAEPEQVHLRIANYGDVTYIDMGDTSERAISIGPGGWSLVDTAPVLFYRTRLTGAYPVPSRGGSLESLWATVNIATEDRPLVLAWLVHALISPDTPHPILSLFAEQGSGKSSGTKVLVALADPSPVPLRKPPKDMEGWVTAAAASWVVGLDNMSTISAWLSDSMCRAVTGEGDVRRALYTDGDVTVFNFKRCLVVNGIDIGAMKGDYAERSLVARLRRIPPAQRRTENALAEQWDRAYPLVLGALLDLAAGVKRVLPSVRLDSSPRMADFAHTLAAVDMVLGTEGFKHYVDQAQDLAVDSLESEPFIVELQDRIRSEFVGTAGELLEKVTPTKDDWKRPQGWPQDGRRVTSIMARNAPALRQAGWIAEDIGRGGKSKSKRWKLTPPLSNEDTQCREEGNSCPPCPPCPPPQVTASETGGQSGGHSSDVCPPCPPDDDHGGQGGGQGGHSGGQRNDVCPPDFSPSTSNDRHSGQGGQEIPLSLANGSDRPGTSSPERSAIDALTVESATCGCGAVMRSRESIARGCCQRCYYRAQAAQRTDDQPADYDDDQTPTGEWGAA